LGSVLVGDRTVYRNLFSHSIVRVLAECVFQWSVKYSCLGFGSMPPRVGQMPVLYWACLFLVVSHLKPPSSSIAQRPVLDMQPPHLPLWKGFAPFTDQQC